MVSGDINAIDEAFLVHKSGCLIEFMDLEKSIEVDYDLTIGMLTAIQAFVKVGLELGVLERILVKD